jgi:flagellar hook-length control protein FliK
VLVTIAAVNVQTTAHHAGATHGASSTHPRNAKSAGDSFDVTLDKLMQAANGDDDADAMAVTPATDAKSGVAKKAGDPTAKDAAADSSCQPITTAKDAATADPAKLVAAKDTDKDAGKDVTKTDTDSPRHRDGDYAQAHLDGTTPPVAPPAVPVPQQAAATTNTAGTPPNTTAAAPVAAAGAAAASAAAVDDQADVPATDIAASSMQAKGTPAKPGETKASPAPTSSKTQARSSAASALADVSKVASRTFADQKTVSPAPDTAHLDGAKPTGTNGTTATQPQPATTQGGQTNPNTGQTAQTEQTQAAVQPAAAHTPAPQQPAQAPVGNAIAAATAAQQASATPTSGAATQLSAQLQIAHPPATSTADTASLAFTIASRSQDGAKHFDIRLDPAELGRIDVHMTVDDAGKTQAALSVEKPQTLELLQKDSGQLERALKDSGLDLTQNGLSFSLKGQQQQAGNGGNGNGSSSRGRTLAARAIAAVDSAASNISLGQMSASDTRLDIRV